MNHERPAALGTADVEDDMSEQTPSQAEGEREQDTTTHQEAEESGHRDVPRTTPSQAEGDREDDADDAG